MATDKLSENIHADDPRRRQVPLLPIFTQVVKDDFSNIFIQMIKHDIIYLLSSNDQRRTHLTEFIQMTKDSLTNIYLCRWPERNTLKICIQMTKDELIYLHSYK